MKKFGYLKRNLKILLILFPLLFLYITICSIKYVSAISNDLCNSVFRLHIIANSNSTEDQNLKYKVRDSILAYMNELCLNQKSKEDVIFITNKHLGDFKQIALNTIHENGFEYDVSVEINNSLFPTKSYGDITLPEGYYDSLKIKIGDSCGKNWWCVMFPPLCFVDISSGIVPDESKHYMEDNLNEEEYKLISNNTNPEINFKFKLIELFNHNNWSIAKK